MRKENANDFAACPRCGARALAEWGQTYDGRGATWQAFSVSCLGPDCDTNVYIEVDVRNKEFVRAAQIAAAAAWEALRVAKGEENAD